MSCLKWFTVLLLLCVFCPNANAETIYQSPADFVREVFGEEPPTPAVLAIAGERREIAAEILGHTPPMLRQRYWKKGETSVWILEEIGKTKPITAGFVVKDGRISDVRVLIYRESHGGEVRHSFFTKQFIGVTLDQQRLSEPIDGISGATLSVYAMKKLAALALFFDQEVRLP